MADGRAATTTPAVRCPICGGPAKRHSTAGDRERYSCRDATCGLRFLYPRPTPTELTELYRIVYYPSEGPGSVHTYENTPEVVGRAFLNAVEAHIGPIRGRRLLDFGAGIGGFALIAREAGAEVTCIETAPEARSQLSALGLSSHADLASLLEAEPGARFDVVSGIEVVEHLADPVADLGALRAVIAPGGSMFLATPNFTSLKARLKGADWEQYVNPTHLMYFTPVSLERVLRAAGFTTVTRLPTRVTYPAHGTLRRLVQHALQRTGLDGDLSVLASG